MKTKQSQKLTDQLRKIVETCGISRYRISKDTGISEPTLTRLMTGERFLSARALDTLGDYLGLELRTTTKESSKKEEK